MPHGASCRLDAVRIDEEVTIALESPRASPASQTLFDPCLPLERFLALGRDELRADVLDALDSAEVE